MTKKANHASPKAPTTPPEPECPPGFMPLPYNTRVFVRRLPDPPRRYYRETECDWDPYDPDRD